MLFILLLGIGIYAYISSKPEEAKKEVTNDSIQSLIAPIVEQQSTFTFEDELPNPVPLEQIKIAGEHNPDLPKLAIIIDDVGYNLKALRHLLALPYTITVAILPDAPYAKEAAQMAYQHGIPVMLHMPMETTNPKYRNKMEQFYLHSTMSKEVFTEVFESALAKVPHVVGVNNHMGSALTENPKSMLWLMELCKKHGLFFIDSRTSSKSIAAKTARDFGISWNQRDIFLDHSIEQSALSHAWDSAIKCISKSEYCVMLAHPHKETVAFLEEHAQDLNPQTMIHISDILK